MGNTSKWKESLAERTSSRQHVNLMKLVYGKLRQTSTTSSNEAHDTSDEESDRGEFFRPVGEINEDDSKVDGENAKSEDCSKYIEISNDLDPESIRDRFVTGDWSKAALRNESSEVQFEDDDNVYADFEDLETGEKYESSHAENTTDAVQKAKDSTNEERRLKKLALRAQFDAEYPFDDFDLNSSFFSPPSFRNETGFLIFF
ncbi:unnamed protein product [Citrullus colocynthis]|uniref:Uncharacterized protein n=1 Tax=Citrullus colocynthis TaxID=252529 RepID=A0ABP0XSE6_9ROSI